MTKEQKTETLTGDELKAAVSEEAQGRITKCQDLLARALRECNCALVPVRRETPQGVEWGVEVAAKQG